MYFTVYLNKDEDDDDDDDDVFFFCIYVSTGGGEGGGEGVGDKSEGGLSVIPSWFEPGKYICLM